MEADIASSEDNPTERIVRGLVDVYYQHAAVFAMFYTELFREGTPIRRFYSEHREFNSIRIERMIRKLVAKGIYRPDLDAVAATWILLSLVIGPTLPMYPVSLFASNGRVPTEVWIDKIVRMVRTELANVT